MGNDANGVAAQSIGGGGGNGGLSVAGTFNFGTDNKIPSFTAAVGGNGGSGGAGGVVNVTRDRRDDDGRRCFERHSGAIDRRRRRQRRPRRFWLDRGHGRQPDQRVRRRLRRPGQRRGRRDGDQHRRHHHRLAQAGASPDRRGRSRLQDVLVEDGNGFQRHPGAVDRRRRRQRRLRLQRLRRSAWNGHERPGRVTVGGFGGSGGIAGNVNVTNDGLITTWGANANGIEAQSIGGGGGNGGDALTA